MKIKSIIFDSSVLIELQTNKMKEETNKIISYYLPADEFMKEYKKEFKKLQLGKLKEEEFYQKLLKELPARSAKRVKEQHDNKRNQLVKLRPEVKGVLTTLHKNYKLGLISNMPKCWFNKDAARLGLSLETFNTIVFSCEQGILKPDVKIYKQACKELKESNNRCAYVTNHDYEIEGAVNAGITVISLGTDNGDMRIDNLNELVELFSTEDAPGKNLHEVNTP